MDDFFGPTIVPSLELCFQRACVMRSITILNLKNITPRVKIKSRSCLLQWVTKLPCTYSPAQLQTSLIECVADFSISTISHDLQNASISNFACEESVVGGQCTPNFFLVFLAFFRKIQKKSVFHKHDFSRSVEDLSFQTLHAKINLVGGQCP